jgi:hypothetical protein
VKLHHPDLKPGLKHFRRGGLPRKPAHATFRRDKPGK